MYVPYQSQYYQPQQPYDYSSPPPPNATYQPPSYPPPDQQQYPQYQPPNYPPSWVYYIVKLCVLLIWYRYPQGTHKEI